MSGDHNPPARGAQRETEFPPFGDQPLRQEWLARAAALDRLEPAVAALVAWRAQHTSGVVVTDDARWIEARLEERVAVLRFEELSHETIRTRTITGEPIAGVVDSFLTRAAPASATACEQLAAEWRQRYKPPILPSAAFLRVEALLSEALMKRRSLGWFVPSLHELRARRGVTVIKEGLTPPTGS
jgi:methane monooxygenase component A gamma chain